MTPWYNLYSYWIFIAFLLTKQLSLYPSIIIVNIGLIILLSIKLNQDTIKFTLDTMCITLVIFITHVLPLILSKPAFDKYTITANLCIFIAYLIILHLQKLTIFQVYQEILKENPNESFLQYLKNRRLI